MQSLGLNQPILKIQRHVDPFDPHNRPAKLPEKKIYNHIKPKAQFSLRVMEKNGIRNVSNTSHIWSGNKILSKCSSDLTLLPPTLETKLILEGKDEKIDRFQSQQKSVFLIWVFQL